MWLRPGKETPPIVGQALDHDWDRLVTFYEFPKAHWKHLRTTNPVESPFAAVRLRTAAAKRYKKVDNATAVIWKTLLELLERLAALVPTPRRPLLAYHGLLAPRAEWRAAIVAKPASDGPRADAGVRSPRRWTWARLLHRVFAIQILVCERCGGPRRILGAVTEPHVVRRVLVALGLAAEPPPARPVPAA